MSKARWLIIAGLLVLSAVLMFGAPSAWSHFRSLQGWMRFSSLQEWVAVAAILCMGLAAAVFMTRKPRAARSALGQEDLVVALDTAVGPSTEAFRTLRAKLVNLGRSRSVCSISVLSAGRGEGRSTVALNLAIAMAQADKAVVLVDVDMRNPALHNAFELDGRHGLSDALENRCPIAQAIYATDLPRLRVIPAGTTPSAAIELLSSERMGQLWDELRNQADLIVADTPACLDGSDALLVAPLSDVALYVVRPGQEDPESQKRIRTDLELAGVNVLGVVVNNADGLLSR